MSAFFPPGVADAGAPPDPALLGGIPGLPPGPPPQLSMQPPPEEEDPDPLSSLQDAIHSVTSAMHALPDPSDTHEVGKALVLLAGVQKRLMQGAGPQQGQ